MFSLSLTGMQGAYGMQLQAPNALGLLIIFSNSELEVAIWKYVDGGRHNLDFLD